MEIGKYREELKIHNHYTNYKGRLFIKTLCDLFNDVAEGKRNYWEWMWIP